MSINAQTSLTYACQLLIWIKVMTSLAHDMTYLQHIGKQQRLAEKMFTVSFLYVHCVSIRGHFVFGNNCAKC